MISFENGNINTKKGVKKHWVIGDFIEPKDSPFNENKFLLKWTPTKKGEKRPGGISVGSEFNTLDILIRGKHKIEFPTLNKSVILENEGDYVFFGPNISHEWETLEDSLLLTLRWVSTKK